MERKKSTRVRRGQGKRDNSAISGHPVLVIAKAIRDIHRIGVKSQKLGHKLKAYGLPDQETVNLAARITQCAKELETQLVLVPSTWRAAKGSVGSAPVDKGDTVQLTKEAAKRYHGVVPADQRFTVEKIVGSKLLCVAIVAGTGEKLMLPLPRSNVQRVEKEAWDQ